MKQFKSTLSALFAFALLFAAFVFALPSPSLAAENTTQTTNKVVENDFAVAVGYADTVKAAAPSAPTNFANIITAPPVVLPGKTATQITRKFYGYQISRNFGKIPIKPLNINAVGRAEPELIPLT